MTVKELIERLQTLPPDDIVKIYDADTEQLEAVSGYLYEGNDHIVELCSDDMQD